MKSRAASAPGWHWQALRLASVFAFLALTGCTKFDLLNATIPCWGYDRTPNLAYGQNPRQTLDVYRPKNAAPNTPVVIFFYGGYWQYGHKEDYRFAAQALASRGFVAILPDYRLHPDVTFPAFVEDGALAVRWAHDNAAHFGGDPARLYLMGHSAGAHIAALLTLDPHYLKAVGLDRAAIRATVGLSGPYDFTPGPNSRAVFSLKEGATPDPNIEPITFADASAPPILLLHGADDEVVKPDNALHLANRITERGGSAQYILYPNRGHPSIVMALAWPFRHLAPVLDDATRFFHDH